jgi:MoxR-like ATPase
MRMTQENASLQRILAQLDTLILGKSRTTRLATACLLARGHLLIEDVPGVGKSTLAQGLARLTGLSFARVQCTNDLLPADLLGFNVWDAANAKMRFTPGPIFHSMVLIDELNRAPSKTQSALLEAMEERQVSIDGETRGLSDPFFVVATQNPMEQIGTAPLPESQLDRFLMRVSLGYPDAEHEKQLLLAGDARAQLAGIAPQVSAEELRTVQRAAMSVQTTAPLIAYVHRLLVATRTGANGFGHGLSPRAGLALVAAARAYAYLSGQTYVAPDDVQAVFGAVASHRLPGGDEAVRRVVESVAV